MAKADRKSSTPEDLTTYVARLIEEQLDELDRRRARVRVANPHYLASFVPTKLAVSPLYFAQHNNLGTMTPNEQRQYHKLRTKAARAGLSEAPPPPDRRGRKKRPDVELLLLPKLERFLQRARYEGLEETAALRRWVTQTKEGKQVRGKNIDAIIDRLQRKLRKFERLKRI